MKVTRKNGRLMKPEEVAEYLGVSIRMVNELYDCGEIATITLDGSKTRLTIEEEIDSFLGKKFQESKKHIARIRKAV